MLIEVTLVPFIALILLTIRKCYEEDANKLTEIRRVLQAIGGFIVDVESTSMRWKYWSTTVEI